MQPQTAQTALKAATAITASFVLSACVAVNPSAKDFQPSAHVTAIQTDHSAALRCLGMLIDDSDAPAVKVAVTEIRDRTVPRRFEDRRLSKGGKWWFHTALAKIDSAKVVAVIEDTDDVQPLNDYLVLTGAWTQDDRLGARRDGGLAAKVGNFAFALGAQDSYDLIVGDFTSAVGERVTHASAIGVLVASRSGDAELIWDNGDDSAAVDLGISNREGPQTAQRHIVEAAVVLHLADYFGVDFKPCFELDWGDPRFTRSLITDYRGKSAEERHAAVQGALGELGYYTGPIDGIWGTQSAAALMRFETDANLPVTGEPAAASYLNAKIEIKRREREAAEAAAALATAEAGAAGDPSQSL